MLYPQIIKIDEKINLKIILTYMNNEIETIYDIDKAYEKLDKNKIKSAIIIFNNIEFFSCYVIFDGLKIPSILRKYNGIIEKKVLDRDEAENLELFLDTKLIQLINFLTEKTNVKNQY
ncbi:MAG: hypothetical protein NC918_02675 [Candidatus Omnitrophica bacterium]|nr:hypothetical protein [Candidatus Omnitrophota bacterium]